MIASPDALLNLLPFENEGLQYFCIFDTIISVTNIKPYEKDYEMGSGYGKYIVGVAHASSTEIMELINKHIKDIEWYINDLPERIKNLEEEKPKLESRLRELKSLEKAL